MPGSDGLPSAIKHSEEEEVKEEVVGLPSFLTMASFMKENLVS